MVCVRQWTMPCWLVCTLSFSPEAILPHYWLALAVCQQCTSIQSSYSISILITHNGYWPPALLSADAIMGHKRCGPSSILSFKHDCICNSATFSAVSFIQCIGCSSFNFLNRILSLPSPSSVTRHILTLNIVLHKKMLSGVWQNFTTLSAWCTAFLLTMC